MEVSRPEQGKDQSKKGFTLVEIVVVLLITAVFFTMAGPLTGKAVTNFNLRHTANMIALDIREVQQRALTECSADYRIEFDKDRYKLKKSAHPIAFTIDDVQLPSTIKIKHTTFNGNPMYFSNRGIPGAGTISIVDESTGIFRYVIIAVNTGRVRISDQPSGTSCKSLKGMISSDR